MCLATEIRFSITVCSWQSVLKQVSSPMVGAFSCYSVLTTLPYILNKINVIKVVKVILELLKLDKHTRINTRAFYSLHIFMFIKVIWVYCNVIYVTFYATPFKITEILLNNFL